MTVYTTYRHVAFIRVFLTLMCSSFISVWSCRCEWYLDGLILQKLYRPCKKWLQRCGRSNGVWGTFIYYFNSLFYSNSLMFHSDKYHIVIVIIMLCKPCFHFIDFLCFMLLSCFTPYLSYIVIFCILRRTSRRLLVCM